MKCATLDNIAQYLNLPGTGKPTQHELALLFLPDIIAPDLLDPYSAKIEWKPKSLSYLIRGNYNEADSHTFDPANLETAPKSDAFSNTKKTDALLNAIKTNMDIQYKNNGGATACRDDMLKKIDYLVSRTPPHKLNALFDELHILPSVKTETEKDVRGAIDALVQRKNYSYALFLLSLTSVFRGKIEEMSFLYCKDAIQRTAISSSFTAKMPDDCQYLTDQNYVNRTYRVFMYRDLHGEDHIYANGTLSLDYSSKIPTAQFELFDEYKEPAQHRYVGTPILTGKTVYIPMGDEYNGHSLGILCFAYEQFTNKLPMYFRSGLLLSCNCRYNTPQVQKVIITSKEEFSKGDLIAIKGQLRTSGTNIIFSREDLDDFCSSEEIQEEIWLPKFRKWILPSLENSAFVNACITEEMIRDFPKGNFSSQELIKISLAFKNYAESHWRKKNTYINCEVPEDLHYLMREEF